MPQKAGGAGSNKVSDCCKLNLEIRKEMLGHPVKVNVLDMLRNIKFVI